MANERFMKTDLSVSGTSNLQPAIPYGIHALAQSATNFFDQEGAAYFGELEEALMQGVIGIRNEGEKKAFLTTRPPPTLEIFPSWPMRIQQGSGGTSQSEDSTDSGSTQNAISQMDSDSPISKKGSSDHSGDQKLHLQEGNPAVAGDASRTAPPNHHLKTQDKNRAGDRDGELVDAKTLRRLAQNREAARKSRLRKKAYVQNLESSRLKLAQLEQDLQRARSQGLLVENGGGSVGSISSGAAIFDLEYSRWLEENYKHMSDLRGSLQVHLGDGELRLIVDESLAHSDELFRLKGSAAKDDVFHLITGMWTTPAERCFLWIGGFRPSELLKMLMSYLEPLTEQQVMTICSLQQSSQQAEEALSHGLQQLHQSMAETIAASLHIDAGGGGSANAGNFMGHMAIALGKLSNIEGFVRQADNLRQQTLHQMRQILTIRQAARFFLAIGEYDSRLRALSSLWASRPREYY